MGNAAVKPKIAEASKVTSNASNVLRLRGTFVRPARPFSSSSYYRFFSTIAYPSIYGRLNRNTISPNSPINGKLSVLQRSLSLFSTYFQVFDKLPHRPELLLDTQPLAAPNLLKLSSLVPDFDAAMVMHCSFIKTGALAHLPTATFLLTFYSRAGAFNSSCALFNEFDEKDIVFWNAMITASIENYVFETAFNFFIIMVKEGHGFDSTTLLLCASALSHIHNLKQARNIHGLSFKSGMLYNSSLCNAIIDMYAKCGDLGSSECAFAELETRDIISWNSIMSGSLHNGQPEKTLGYFKEMICSDERADVVSLSSAIAASASLGERNTGEVFHAMGFKLGYDCSHISVANSLISFYSQRGNMEASEAVFKGMTRKDIVSWNTMLHGFASNEMIPETFKILHEMQQDGSFKPDIVTIISVTPLCSELMLLREGRAIHGYIIRQEMEVCLSVANSLIDMYSKCECPEKAELLFLGIPQRDLISWNSMISGYCQNELYERAQELFKEMLHLCSDCSLSTLLAILSSCTAPEGLHFGRSIHSWQLKVGIPSNIVAVNSLMHMYIYCGDLASAFALLQSVSSVADVSSWNTMITGCTQNSHLREALETFNLMNQEGSASCDTITLGNVISACGNLQLVSEGKSLHALALKTSAGLDLRVQNALIAMYGRFGDTQSASQVFHSSPDRNLCSWNCLISAFSQNKDGKEALELFQYLEFKPNDITIVGILSACTQLGVIGLGKQIHGYTLRNGFQGNAIISSALLEMYGHCGKLDIAVQLFKCLEEKTVVCWNSMISAYGYHGNGTKAIELFHEMSQSGQKASGGTFVSLLSACSHSGLVDQGIHYYQSMYKEYGVKPGTDHHVCMVDMLGRSGRFHDALHFIKQMQTRPEAGVWGALLSACHYHGEIDIGREVAELLFQLEPQNTGYYISLSNMYIAAGRWKEAVRLRNIVEDRHLKKPTGYSVIELGFG